MKEMGVGERKGEATRINKPDTAAAKGLKQISVSRALPHFRSAR